MFKSYILLACIFVLANLSFSQRHNASSRVNLLSMNGDDSSVYNDWANYHKKTEAKLDNVLAKCYECIEKKSGYHEQTVCSDFTGLNTITSYGVLYAGTSFLNGAYTSYNPSYGYAQVNTYNYGGKSSNPFSQSISCMVGESEGFSTVGLGPVPMPCEYGNSYCSITLNDPGLFNGPDSEIYHFACAAVCNPSANQICTTGTLSNKISPICFDGDLNLGSAGASAVLCDIGDFCLLDATNAASCGNDCDANKCTFDDYSNKVGPICWVGTFDKDAVMKSCGGDVFPSVTVDFCTTYKNADGSVSGACSSDGNAPAGTTLIIKTKSDFGNKQGPICFVGQFGDKAVATACTLGKVCQRETVQTEVGTTITIGSCVAKCYPSRTTFCCSTDLCNTYHSEVNYEVREQTYHGEYHRSTYTAPPSYGGVYNTPSYNGYNKQPY